MSTDIKLLKCMTKILSLNKVIIKTIANNSIKLVFEAKNQCLAEKHLIIICLEDWFQGIKRWLIVGTEDLHQR